MIMSLDTKFSIASRLAQFLRRNGAKVINGSCKLSLTTSALCLLNTLFWDLLDDEGRFSSHLFLPEDVEISEDIQFLYSFIKRTTTLKLFHGVQTLRGGVDLSYFTSLTVLELRKIPAHLLIGLDLLSDQLKVLICSRSIYLMKELFGSSMDGSTVKTHWNELLELNLSYNYLECLDNSLKSLPNLEVLNLSHNHIRNSDEIKVLKSLKFVNMSFNELNCLPVFSTEGCRFLTKLYLRNNNLENLCGLECIFNLEEFDVAFNLLSEYSVLNPLEKLKSLRMLNLEGNPIFFHNRHTILVSDYINPAVLNRGLHLNGKLFAVPCIQSPLVSDLSGSSAFNHQTSINTVVGDADSTMRAPVRSSRTNYSSSSSVSDLDENSVSSVASQKDRKSLVNKRKPRKKKRKSRTSTSTPIQREALIQEPEEHDKEDLSKDLGNKENITAHIKARQAIEARRQERGETWLIPDLSHQTLTVTPPIVPFNTPVVSSIPPQMVSDADLASKLTDCFTLTTEISQSPGSATIPIAASPSAAEMVEVLDIVKECGSELVPPDRTRCGSKESDDIEILPSESSSCGDLSASKDNLSECDIYRGSKSANADDETLSSEEESEDNIFFVENEVGSKRQALSVTLGPKYLREKDVITGKYLENLDMTSLLSISLGSKEEGDKLQHKIHLEFDTLKSTKQKRLYLMENLERAEALSKILQPFADAKTLKDVTLGALECFKCNSQFSKQAAHKKLIKRKLPPIKKAVLSSSYDSSKEYEEEVDACPNCGNHILAEMETVPLPSVAMPTLDVTKQLNSTKKTSDKSPDVLSTGSPSSGSIIASLFSSIKLSPILKRKSVPVSANEQLNQETESVKVENSADQIESDLSSESYMRRNSSDITIISNPSLNSITVMQDTSTSMEINLNTIAEMDSQASLSPTTSQGHVTKRAKDLTESQEVFEGKIMNERNEEKNKYEAANGEEHGDYYSFTESLADETKDFNDPNEVVSSGTENYQSPVKVKRTSVHSAELDESTQLINILGEKTTVTHDMFSELNHRLKLHLEINVFGKEEEFQACLQTSIVPLTTGDEFQGLFALSSHKLYIIKFLPLYDLCIQQNEPVDKAIQIIHSCPLNQLKQVKVVLGNQGLSVACGSSVFTLLIRDADICNCFSSLLTEMIHDKQFEFGKVEFFSSTRETLKQLQSSVFSSVTESDEVPEVLLHLFAFWWDCSVHEKDSSHPVCIIITSNDIFVARILYKKQESCTDLNNLCLYHYTVLDHQKISDLVSLELKNDLRSIEMNFINDSSSENCDWTIKTETKSSLFSLISAVKSPWEEIFKVPLPLSSEEKYW
ncbi:serine/threonine-protein kinase 11-interacting protein isoform X3 [Parasteatoda tepidariorum]|uniref:serine/threonine-protein kinase 11-interacting protein isoform X3 n=1 Tax=Parasteatoda tepidariorum TaxID=114398 RepID=UPI001C7192FC|nr:serine/threonine-protein kinase 11-interacting protein isoform X3 [Parasteatoda tepidariorum]